MQLARHLVFTSDSMKKMNWTKENWLNEKEIVLWECNVKVLYQKKNYDNLHLNRLLYQRPDTWMWRTRDISCARQTSKLLTARHDMKRHTNWIRDRQSYFSHGIIAEIEIYSSRLVGYSTLALESLFAETPKLKMKRKRR